MVCLGVRGVVANLVERCRANCSVTFAQGQYRKLHTANPPEETVTIQLIHHNLTSPALYHSAPTTAMTRPYFFLIIFFLLVDAGAKIMSVRSLVSVNFVTQP